MHWLYPRREIITETLPEQDFLTGDEAIMDLDRREQNKAALNRGLNKRTPACTSLTFRYPDFTKQMSNASPAASINFNSQVESTAETERGRNDVKNRLAVCSWSLQPTSLQDFITKMRATGLDRVQIALDPLRDSPKTWRNTAKFLRNAKLSLVSGMFGCVGEDYSTLESIHRTGGIAPDSTWEQNLKNILATAKRAAELGLRLVTLHAGFLPTDESNPAFSKMLGRLTTVTEIFAKEKIHLALETGQESAPALAALLTKLNHPNLVVNLDPANMILYGRGDPIEAIRILRPWIWQIHIKDAKRTIAPGTWGEEVIVGTGDVDWKSFFATLKKINFDGNFVIEREAGNQRAADICKAREVMLNIHRLKA
jgi:L-ribulose-5-phosphate 3-epimerase